MSSPTFIGAEQIGTVRTRDAIAALGAAAITRSPDPHRMQLPVGAGALLVMPSVDRGVAGVKLVSVDVGDGPRVQGVYALFDRQGRVRWVMDAAALTALRTAALSALVVTRTGRPSERLTLFGTGVQALSHARALVEAAGVVEIVCVGRDTTKSKDFAARLTHELDTPARAGVPGDIRSADVVVTATTATEPVFDGEMLSPAAVVVSVGVHQPDVREVDAATVRRSAVIVEEAGVARRECGNLLLAEADGHAPGLLSDLAAFLADAEVVTRHGGPILFSSSGMAWEDLAVAQLIIRSV